MPKPTHKNIPGVVKVLECLGYSISEISSMVNLPLKYSHVLSLFSFLNP